MTDIKKQALANALKELQKKHGKDSINVMKDAIVKEIDTFSSGSIILDKVLGVNGFPKGRIIEIYGPESSGKTTLALQAMAEVQKLGGTVAFIDVEQAMDLKYAKALGINVDELVFSQPFSGEEVLDSVEVLSSSGGVDLIVVDSVAALQTKAELEGNIGDQHIGQVARLMSQSLKKIIAVASKTNTTVIFINQIRDKIGVMGYGEKTTTSGGNALKFYASIRLDVRRIASIKVKEEVVGNKIKITTKKNKVAPPYRTAETEIYFGKGISLVSELVDLGVEYNIIDKAGAWFSYGEMKLGQGKQAVMEKLENEENLKNEIKEKILEMMNS